MNQARGAGPLHSAWHAQHGGGRAWHTCRYSSDVQNWSLPSPLVSAGAQPRRLLSVISTASPPSRWPAVLRRVIVMLCRSGARVSKDDDSTALYLLDCTATMSRALLLTHGHGALLR